MPAVCEGLVTKLNELMDFLYFAKLPNAKFRGVVTFMFRNAPTDQTNVACIRTIDMRRGLEVDTTMLHPQDPYLPEVAVVNVSLADFLHMYSGEATTSEIARMVMSGRVAVPWDSYGKLKAFADCFDFSTEKWVAYYADIKARAVVVPKTECKQMCCVQSMKEEDIEANWLIVSDATTTSGGGEWQVVTDLQCRSVVKEQRRENTLDLMPLEAWLANLWNGKGGRLEDGRPGKTLNLSVKNSFRDLKAMAGKVFVSLEA